MLDVRDTYTPIVQRMFGESARFDGSIGTPHQPGSVRIILGGAVVGTGGTFQAALQDVTRSCSREKAVA